MKKIVNCASLIFFFFISSGFDSTISAQGVSRDFTANVRLNEINPQAFRHFRKNYASIVNENWFKTEAGYMVNFADQLVINQVFYDHRGNFMHCVRYLEEKDLGKEISTRISKLFPDYQIDAVGEIISNEDVFYLVGLRNKISVKNIMITESEFKVLENLVYASR